MNNQNPVFSLQREYKASKGEVFDAFKSAEALAQWWGPVEAPIQVLKLDFKPNGIFHYKMNGVHINYGIFRYLDIDEPNSIVWINSFANENGEVIKPPFDGIDFPKEIRNTLTLVEQNGVTILTLVSEPIHATENEIATFYAFTESMGEGFGGTFKQLEEYLVKK